MSDEKLKSDLSLLKLQAGDRTVYFVIASASSSTSIEELQKNKAFFFQEHSCPTNWLKDVVAVIEDGNDDPHGVLEFVRSVFIPDDASIEELEEKEKLLSIFPEAFNKK